MTTCAAEIRAQLLASLPPGATSLAVGLSGGADSAVLLTVLASAPRALPLRALHIDHGLQPAAADFRRFCRALCERLDVALAIHETAIATDGVSIEAAARAARYAVFARELDDGECLVTAHHRDDQAETLLLQLLRGAGPKGLACMPPCRAFARGWHLRPLLNVSRDTLRRLGAELGSGGVDDPMNTELRFDRAFLRVQVLPSLQARWPAASSALARSAAHLAGAQAMLDQMAAAQLRRVRDGEALSVIALRNLEPLERVNALRYWLGSMGVEPPSTARLSEALRQMLNARHDHLPVVVWGEVALRRYRDRLFLTPAAPPSLTEPLRWDSTAQASLALGPRLGTLRWRPRRGGLAADRLPAALQVRRRRGGESLRPAGNARTQTLQHLCQLQGVLPWMRGALPLIFAEEQLIAVGDLWSDARWCVAAGEMGVAVFWEGAPALV